MDNVSNYVSHRRPVRAVASESRGENVLIRATDVVLAAVLIAFLSPLFVLAACCCWLQDDGPILFCQMRLGRGGKLFACYKFRSMVVDSAESLASLLRRSPVARAEWERDQKLRNDPRITKWGRFMRKTSIDELPQLFNVIRGEMSLVGPRPIVPSEASRYGRYIAQYYSVPPGLTGLWQVSGRNRTSYRRRVALDVAYARSRSYRLYLRILLATIPAVLFSDGAF
jgi:lipopolysaccharide/colanic/teichoic acid biosynthesis glycosyltransferase